jgi:hypothetical protein
VIDAARAPAPVLAHHPASNTTQTIIGDLIVATIAILIWSWSPAFFVAFTVTEAVGLLILQ